MYAQASIQLYLSHKAYLRTRFDRPKERIADFTKQCQAHVILYLLPLVYPKIKDLQQQVLFCSSFYDYYLCLLVSSSQLELLGKEFRTIL